MFNGRSGLVEGSNTLRRSLCSYVDIIITWESTTGIDNLIAATKEIENIFFIDYKPLIFYNSHVYNRYNHSIHAKGICLSSNVSSFMWSSRTRTLHA